MKMLHRVWFNILSCNTAHTLTSLKCWMPFGCGTSVDYCCCVFACLWRPDPFCHIFGSIKACLSHVKPRRWMRGTIHELLRPPYVFVASLRLLLWQKTSWNAQAAESKWYSILLPPEMRADSGRSARTAFKQFAISWNFANFCDQFWATKRTCGMQLALEGMQRVFLSSHGHCKTSEPCQASSSQVGTPWKTARSYHGKQRRKLGNKTARSFVGLVGAKVFSETIWWLQWLHVDTSRFIGWFIATWSRKGIPGVWKKWCNSLATMNRKDGNTPKYRCALVGKTALALCLLCVRCFCINLKEQLVNSGEW